MRSNHSKLPSNFKCLINNNRRSCPNRQANIKNCGKSFFHGNQTYVNYKHILCFSLRFVATKYRCWKMLDSPFANKVGAPFLNEVSFNSLEIIKVIFEIAIWNRKLNIQIFSCPEIIHTHNTNFNGVKSLQCAPSLKVATQRQKIHYQVLNNKTLPLNCLVAELEVVCPSTTLFVLKNTHKIKTAIISRWTQSILHGKIIFRSYPLVSELQQFFNDK